jgi:protein SCO1/2
MNRIRLFLCFLAVLLLIRGQVVSAQEGTSIEAGIIEQLDTIIPASVVFTNETGQTVNLRSVITKPTILVLVYFDCPGICPAILSGVSDVVEKLGLELGKEYQIVTVSFNPADTPEKAVSLKQNYLHEHSRTNAGSWMYFTGDTANINALTRAVGYYFKPMGNDFMHPSCIIVLSPQAKVTRYLYGTSFLPFDVKMALVEAQKGQSRPTINRVLEYCFSYDPEGRKYTLQVTKIAATIIIFFAVVLLTTLIIRSSRKKKKTNQ